MQLPVDVGGFGLWGAVSAAVSQVQGALFYVAKTVVHGAIGGALSVIQGGEFLAGFAASAAGAIGGMISGESGLFGEYGDGITGNVIARAVISGVAGGVGSVLAGGKFENGAVTAAFASMYNGDRRLIDPYADMRQSPDGAPPLCADYCGPGLPPLTPYDNGTSAEARWYGLNVQGVIASIIPGGGAAVGTIRLGVSGHRYYLAATGGLKQWVRIGNSYSKGISQKTWGIRWGASPYYASRIGNSTLRSLNQSFRQTRIPGAGWRTRDPGHLHFWKK